MMFRVWTRKISRTVSISYHLGRPHQWPAYDDRSALVLQYRRCYNFFDHGEPTPMSNQNAFIRHSLNQIGDLIQQQELVQSTASKARALGDPQRQAFWDKLGLQETLLRRLLHQLHQTAVTFEWERTHPWRIPRHQRYPAGNR